ncbi:hypothetical protein BBK36DRAFT_23406 [Trichoderma citrinoviride]|uniref:Uncharacterized protein n=1 Tax=Trichoderma citrinoviride TaxID=58853 RepID=A0A2T4AZY6_9HYPO|nr:hypothetical protein BBK36DRAFT_23406 [Trichoderma citrinoviride]PTB62634.1 hypothetical protein BBK36DRAFT_23406 [Trichoderma citrinoviride]
MAVLCNTVLPKALSFIISHPSFVPFVALQGRPAPAMDAENASVPSDTPTNLGGQSVLSSTLFHHGRPEWEDVKIVCRKLLEKGLDDHIEADCESILRYIKSLFHKDCGPLTGPFWNPHHIEDIFKATVKHAKQQQQGKDKVILSRDSFEAVVPTPHHWYSLALGRAKSKMDQAAHLGLGHM